MEPEKKNSFSMFFILLLVAVVVIVWFLIKKEDKVEIIPEPQEPIATETMSTEPVGSALPPENIDRPAFGSAE